jgi:hypothetical protein
MSDTTIVELANLTINSVQMMFLAYLAARFRPPYPPPQP